MALLLAAALVAVNALFVLAEFALVRVRPARLEMLARAGSRRAAMAQEILSRLDDYLAACQAGITIVSLALGWVGEPAVAAALRPALESLLPGLSPALLHAGAIAVSLAAISWVHIVLGELMPRSAGIQFAEPVALWAAAPLKAFHALLRLPVRLLSASSILGLRLLGMRPAAEAEHAVTVDEMRVMLGDTHEKGALTLERLLLLENLFDLATARAADVMRPREKIAALSLGDPWERQLELLRAKGFSRYPVYERELDDASGYVHLKDLVLRSGGGAPDLASLRRELPSVPLDEPVERLLKTMPDRGAHIALVRDAQGRVAGLVTLEDVLEELVGSVRDEYDRSQQWAAGELFSRAVADASLAPGDRRAAVRRLVERLAAAFPEISAEAAFAAVWERELKFSSAVGKGVLMPHARLPGLAAPLLAVGRYAKPQPAAAPDGQPARLVFLVLTPLEKPVVQLKVLQRVAGLLANENIRRKLLRSKTDEALLAALRTADTLLAS